MTNFEKKYTDSILPIRSTKMSAGYDLYANENIIVPKYGRALVKTGVTCFMDDNEYLAIVPRSGLAIKSGITVLNAPGTIDADYFPNEIGVELFNTTATDFEVKIGDRIAQAILKEYKTMDVDNVKDTERDGGFGSTGNN